MQIEVTAEQKQRIIELCKTRDEEAAQALILAELSKEFGPNRG